MTNKKIAGKATGPRLESPEKNKTVFIKEGDFTDKKVKVVWEGTDPLDDAIVDLNKALKLITGWIDGSVPERVLATSGRELLLRAIGTIKAVDNELAGESDGENLFD